jgi:diaminohydroxyphosphoribosylaminopyrimidine deaminase/5-amino-6-(5-phosphoribosylamino)uracil reductase
VAGTVQGRPAFAAGTADLAVAKTLIRSVRRGESLIFTCALDVAPPWFVDSLVAAGVRGVTFGAPHPLHGKTGLQEALLKAGVSCVFSELCPEFWRLNEARAFAALTGRPLVVAKIATSIDGRIATRTGRSQWITGPEARGVGHETRRLSGAILVGKNTVVADNPTLTARVESAPEGPNPLRVVVSSEPDLPPRSALRDVSVAPTLLFHAVRDAAQESRLNSAGILTCCYRGVDGRVDLRALLDDLHGRGVAQVLIEGGGDLIGSFADAHLIDRLVHFRAPMLIGGAGARASVGGRGIDELSEARRGWRTTARMVGEDVELVTDFALELRAPTCE